MRCGLGLQIGSRDCIKNNTICFENRNNVYKGEHEMIVDTGSAGHYYIAVRPTYSVWTFRDELPVSEVGMFYVRY